MQQLKSGDFKDTKLESDRSWPGGRGRPGRGRGLSDEVNERKPNPAFSTSSSHIAETE